MRKNLISIIFALSFILLIVSPVFASRVEFDSLGKCNIAGIIKAVNFEEAYEDPCVKDNSCPIGAFTPERSARYILSVYIDTLNCIPGEVDNPATYESQFKLNEENSITLNLIDVKDEDQFQQGDKISGTVGFITLAHTFRSYELEKPSEKIVTDDIDNQKNTIDIEQNNKGYIPFVVIAVIVIIGLIVVGVFLIKRR